MSTKVARGHHGAVLPPAGASSTQGNHSGTFRLGGTSTSTLSVPSSQLRAGSGGSYREETIPVRLSPRRSSCPDLAIGYLSAVKPLATAPTSPSRANMTAEQRSVTDRNLRTWADSPSNTTNDHDDQNETEDGASGKKRRRRRRRKKKSSDPSDDNSNEGDIDTDGYDSSHTDWVNRRENHEEVLKQAIQSGRARRHSLPAALPGSQLESFRMEMARVSVKKIIGSRKTSMAVDETTKTKTNTAKVMTPARKTSSLTGLSLGDTALAEFALGTPKGSLLMPVPENGEMNQDFKLGGGRPLNGPRPFHVSMQPDDGPSMFPPRRFNIRDVTNSASADTLRRVFERRVSVSAPGSPVNTSNMDVMHDALSLFALDNAGPPLRSYQQMSKRGPSSILGTARSPVLSQTPTFFGVIGQGAGGMPPIGVEAPLPFGGKDDHRKPQNSADGPALPAPVHGSNLLGVGALATTDTKPLKRREKCILYIDRLPMGTTVRQVKDMFSIFGEVVSARVCLRLPSSSSGPQAHSTVKHVQHQDPELMSDDSVLNSTILLEFARAVQAKSAFKRISAYRKSLGARALDDSPSSESHKDPFPSEEAPPRTRKRVDSTPATPIFRSTLGLNSTSSKARSETGARQNDDLSPFSDLFITTYFAYKKRQLQHRKKSAPTIAKADALLSNGRVRTGLTPKWPSRNGRRRLSKTLGGKRGSLNQNAQPFVPSMPLTSVPGVSGINAPPPTMQQPQLAHPQMHQHNPTHGPPGMLPPPIMVPTMQSMAMPMGMQYGYQVPVMPMLVPVQHGMPPPHYMHQPPPHHQQQPPHHYQQHQQPPNGHHHNHNGQRQPRPPRQPRPQQQPPQQQGRQGIRTQT